MAARLTTYVVVGIVAATLIAGLMAGAQRDDDGPVDLIIHNARVFTADPDSTTAEAVAVRGNQILRVGGNREVTRLRRPQTVVVDAKGRSVLPGFNDAHVHFIEGGLGLQRLDLLDVTTTRELEDRLHAWASANPDRPWIVGRGWRRHLFPNGLPTRQMLDAVVPDRPVHLVSNDGLTAWVNTAALRLARITRKTAAPPGGVIRRDPRTGEATGVLEQSAIALVGHLLPPVTPADRARALRAAITEAHRHGITSIQNVAGTREELDAFEEARRADELAIRVYSAVAADRGLTERELAALDPVFEEYDDDPLFKSGALSVALDGGIDGHTAAMLEPYDDLATAGEPAVGADDLNRMARLVDARGRQMMIGAMGDRAVRMALDAYQHAARSNGESARDRRHRVEGIAIADSADLARFRALGAIASMQPLLAGPEPLRLESLGRALGPDRTSRAWPWRTISSAKGKLAFGSDWPAVPLNPMLGLHTAVNRTTPEGEPEGGWNPAQRLALQAAVTAYTAGGAWASFDDQRKGSITPGMLADMVVLSNDIFAVRPAKIADTTVVMTIFDGRIVYRSADRRETN